MNRLKRKVIIFIFTAFACAEGFANTRYEQVEALSFKIKQSVFRSVVGSGDIGCGLPDEITAMGVNEQGDGRWTVSCSNGQSYLVRVLNDAKGSLKAKNCADPEISEPCLEVDQSEAGSTEKAEVETESEE